MSVNRNLRQKLNQQIDVTNSNDVNYILEKINEQYYQIDGDQVFLRRNLSSNDSIDSSVLSIENIETSSSSSLLSWNDEFRYSESTKKVQDELKKMNGIFLGIEPIPLNYDIEEYMEWMEYFPNLKILPPYENLSDNDDDIDDDNVNTILENCVYKKSIKNTINFNSSKAVSEYQWKIRPQSTIIETIGTNNRNKSTISNNNVDIDNFLKISPISQYYKFNKEKEARIKKRQSLTKSLITNISQKTLTDNIFPVRKIKSGIDNHKPLEVQKKCCLILPPIENSHLRSTSAIILQKKINNYETLTKFKENENFLQKLNITEE